MAGGVDGKESDGEILKRTLVVEKKANELEEMKSKEIKEKYGVRATYTGGGVGRRGER